MPVVSMACSHLELDMTLNCTTYYSEATNDLTTWLTRAGHSMFGLVKTFHIVAQMGYMSIIVDMW